MHSIAILDSHLITGKFSGGGLINAQTLLAMFPSKYSVVYLPKSEVYYEIRENPKLLDNIYKIESTGIVVSKTFKKICENLEHLNFYSYRKKLLSGYISEITSVELVYDNDFHANLYPLPGIIPDILKMCSNAEKVRFGITLRGYSDINKTNNIKLMKFILKNETSSLMNIETLKRYISFSFHPFLHQRINKRISKCRNLAFISFVNSYLQIQNKEINESGARFHLLFPSDISQFKLKEGTQLEKNSQKILFYSRLVPEKGIFEVPRILLEILKLGHEVEMIIAGRFTYKKDEDVFYKLLEKFGVKEHTKFLGFLNEDALRDVLYSSKVLMYPSHSDSFSISILNSLHLKTKVVAYDLPALKDIYGNIPSVRFVKEYDTKAMALAISDILKEDERTYFDSFDNPQTANFLEATGSTEKLLYAISNLIDEAISRSAIYY